nr:MULTISPECIES: GNAT family N-acetyltransferase [unclassified Methylobacterium]
MPTIRAGETYALDRDLSAADALAYWTNADRRTYVAEQDGAVLGTYYLRANQAGGGAHVANCGFMTDTAAAGRGIARAMGTHALHQARAHGFTAMQFNFVVSTNVRAVRLWESLGFTAVGRLPGAFQHPRLGSVDALVMFRTL